MTNLQLLTLILSIVIPLGGLVLVQARALRQDMTQAETRLGENMGHLRENMGQLREDMRQLREDMRQDTARLHQDVKELRGEVSHLRDRMGRIEGTLDMLRQFFLDSGHGTAA